MAKDRIVFSSKHGPEKLWAGLPLQDMRLNLNHTILILSHYPEVDEIVAGLPAGLATVRVNCIDVTANVALGLFDSGVVLVPKKVDRRSPANSILYLITVQAPLGGVMTKDQIDHILHWVEHRLEWAQIETSTAVIVSVHTREQG